MSKREDYESRTEELLAPIAEVNPSEKVTPRAAQPLRRVSACTEESVESAASTGANRAQKSAVLFPQSASGSRLSVSRSMKSQSSPLVSG